MLIGLEPLLLWVRGLGAGRLVDEDGVGSEDLRVLPAGLALGVANVGVGTEFVLVRLLNGLEVLLPVGVDAGVDPGVDAGVDAGVEAGVEEADGLRLLAPDATLELGTSEAGSKKALSS